MSRGTMTRLGRGAPKVCYHVDANRAGTPAGVPPLFDFSHQGTHILSLSVTDFEQRLPQFRLQAHAGAAAFSDNVTIDKATVRHGDPSGLHGDQWNRISLR
jgi:hypothetical protein